MLFAPRIRLNTLALLCRRLATATEAGIDDRKIWSDESARGSRSHQAEVAKIRDSVARGESVADSLPATGAYFPPLFRSMVNVGESSGRLGQTYLRLAQHFDRTRAARRDFLGRLAWPMIQLGMALAVIGLLIFIMGILPVNTGAGGPEVDLLDFGLIGTRGLVVYANVLIGLGILVLLLIEAGRRGKLWTRQLQEKALQIPVLGGALKTLALARLTWALQLVLDTPMDLRKAVPIALSASGNEYFAKHGPRVANLIEQGMSLHMALADTGAFPGDFLDAVAVGEESGRLVETMQHQSEEYQRRAGDAIGILAQLAGYAVWFLVAAFIIVMIFRLFSFYTNTIQSLT